MFFESIPCVDIHSPAKHVVNDITYIVPQMIAPDTGIDEALKVMRLSNRKSVLYIGTGTKFLGVTSGFTLVSRVVQTAGV